MNAQNLKMESGAGEWMQIQYEIYFSNFRESNARNFFSFVFLFLRTITMQKLFFMAFRFMMKTKQMQANEIWCKDRWTWFRSFELWYQMLQAGNQGWQNGWWKLDGSTKDMIGWAIGWNASYDPENKCKNKWDMISNMIKQDK